MNESEFEQELRGLMPKRPSDGLRQAIESELGTITSVVVAAPRTLEGRVEHQLEADDRWQWVWSLLRGLSWAGAGALAAVIVMLSQSQHEPQRTAQTPVETAEAVGTETHPEVEREEMVNEFVSAADEGLVIDHEVGEAKRRVRLSFIERHIWTNPETGAVIEFEVPREDVLTMPIAMQ